MTSTGNWATPDNISGDGHRAATIIRKFCENRGLDTGDDVFHSPSKWSGDYGKEGELIVIHECGSAKQALSLDGAYDHGVSYEAYETLQARLRRAGMYLQQCTMWYSAVHRMPSRRNL